MKTFLLISIFIGITSCRLFCGIDAITNNWMEILLKLDCPAILVNHQECCKTHGWCYIHKEERLEKCDQDYCNCIAKLANSGTCKTHSDNFCQNVKTLGHMMWPIINKNGMVV